MAIVADPTYLKHLQMLKVFKPTIKALFKSQSYSYDYMAVFSFLPTCLNYYPV